MLKLKFLYKIFVIGLVVVCLLVIMIRNSVLNVDNDSIKDSGIYPLSRDYVVSQETDAEILSRKFANLKNKDTQNKTKHIRNNVNIYTLYQSEKIADEYVYLKTMRGKTPIFIYKPEVDNMISSYVKDYGTWEEDLLNQTAHIFKTNKNIMLLDIGCNIGVYTLFNAKLGVRVISVDPVRENLRLLSKSLTLGGMRENVTLILNAISDIYSNISVIIPNGNIGGAYVSAETDPKAANMIINAQTIKLDDLIKFVKDKQVFMKIDIEGFELRALNGARDFFQTVNVRGVLMEWMHHRYTDTGQQIIDILMKNGLFPYSDVYKNTFLDPGGYHLWPENIFWIKR